MDDHRGQRVLRQHVLRQELDIPQGPLVEEDLLVVDGSHVANRRGSGGEGAPDLLDPGLVDRHRVGFREFREGFRAPVQRSQTGREGQGQEQNKGRPGAQASIFSVRLYHNHRPFRLSRPEWTGAAEV